MPKKSIIVGIFTIIVFLDIIRRPVFFVENTFWRLDSLSLISLRNVLFKIKNRMMDSVQKQ
jgi:hypothetical protein